MVIGEILRHDISIIRMSATNMKSVHSITHYINTTPCEMRKDKTCDMAIILALNLPKYTEKRVSQ